MKSLLVVQFFISGLLAFGFGSQAHARNKVAPISAASSNNVTATKVAPLGRYINKIPQGRYINRLPASTNAAAVSQ